MPIEDLIPQTRRIREELLLGTCDSRGNISDLTILVLNAPTSSYDEELEAFYMDLEKFYREDNTLVKELYEFIMTTRNIIRNSRKHHNEIDHIIVNRKFCLPIRMPISH
uniref:Uncharacterized protein n=1 Tax=Angiostrongylus cantonensis TaxID=6313 RepID=A0A0K0DIU6_ANGCA